MVRAGRRDHSRAETRRHDIQYKGYTLTVTPTKRAAHIDDDAPEVPTRDRDRLDIVNVATATENLAIAPEAVSTKTEGEIVARIDAQDLPTKITSGNPQQVADHRLLTKNEHSDLRPANQLTTPPQTQTTL
jgi:hypothetical protein